MTKKTVASRKSQQFLEDQYREAIARWADMDPDTPLDVRDEALYICEDLWSRLTPARQAKFDAPSSAVPTAGMLANMFAALTAACARGSRMDWSGAQVQLIAALERATTPLERRAVQYLLQVTEEARHGTSP